MGVSILLGYFGPPQNRWSVMEKKQPLNYIEMDDGWGYSHDLGNLDDQIGFSHPPGDLVGEGLGKTDGMDDRIFWHICEEFPNGEL